MRKTKEHKCPNSRCGSRNIKDLGSRGPFEGTPKKLPPRPAYFSCNDCGEKFSIE